VSGGKAGRIGDMSGAERVTTGKSSGTAERQATERTEQSSAQNPELCIIRTPNYTLRGLELFVWRRPALHNQKRGRETLNSQSLSLSKQNLSPHVLELRQLTSFLFTPMAPPRNSSSAAAFPPPSCLLLPRVCPPLHTQARNTAQEYIGLPLAFDVVHDELQVDGYQMYAVEKWFVHLFSIRLIP